MYGTEKQIKWAEDIIFGAYTHIDSIIEHFKKAKETEGEKWVEINNDVIVAAEQVREWIDDCVNRVDDAYKWISVKDMFSVAELNAKINKRIRLRCKRMGRMENFQLDPYYTIKKDDKESEEG